MGGMNYGGGQQQPWSYFGGNQRHDDGMMYTANGRAPGSYRNGPTMRTLEGRIDPGGQSPGQFPGGRFPGGGYGQQSNPWMNFIKEYMGRGTAPPASYVERGGSVFPRGDWMTGKGGGPPEGLQTMDGIFAGPGSRYDKSGPDPYGRPPQHGGVTPPPYNGIQGGGNPWDSPWTNPVSNPPSSGGGNTVGGSQAGGGFGGDTGYSDWDWDYTGR